MSNETTNQVKPPDGPRPSQRYWGWILGGIVLLWAILMIVLVPRQKLEKPEVRKPDIRSTGAVYDWSLTDRNGRIVPFSTFKGKTVFLNIWATWCPPCVQEIPSIDKLAAMESLKDVVFLGVTVDEEEDDIRKFVASQKPRFRVVRPLDAIPEVFQTDGIPATFIIGPTGEIEMSHVGSAAWDAPEIVALLEHLSQGTASE